MTGDRQHRGSPVVGGEDRRPLAAWASPTHLVAVVPPVTTSTNVNRRDERFKSLASSFPYAPEARELVAGESQTLPTSTIEMILTRALRQNVVV